MWKTMKLDDITSLSLGKTPSRSNPKFWDKEKNSKNIWLSIADLSASNQLYIDDSKEYVSDEGAKLFKEVPAETLIMSFKLSIGKLAITKCALRTNEAIIAMPIKDKKLISKEYLYYFLSSLNWDVLAGKDIKVKGKTLNKAKLKELPIPVPPLAEQERIVAKLDAAFAEIDKSVTAKQKQLESAEVIVGNFIEKLMEADGDEMSLDDLSLSISDGDHQPPPKSESGVPFITISNVNKQTRKIDFQNTFFVPESYYSNLKQQRKPKRGDVLYTVTGSFGIPVLIDEDVAFCFQRHIAIIRPNRNVLSEWLYYALLSASVFRQADKNATGAAQRTVSLKTLRGIKVNVPTLEKQRRDYERIELIEEQTEHFLKTRREALESTLALKSAILAQELQSEAA